MKKARMYTKGALHKNAKIFTKRSGEKWGDVVKLWVKVGVAYVHGRIPSFD